MSTQFIPKVSRSGGASQVVHTLRAFQESVDLFKYLSPVECRVMYTLTERRSYRDGEVIIREGDQGTGLHIVERGEVFVFKRDAGGKDRPVATIAPYGHFGEMSILNEQPTICTIKAHGSVDVLVMSKREFTNLMHRKESLGVRVLRALCEELSNRLREVWDERMQL